MFKTLIASIIVITATVNVASANNKKQLTKDYIYFMADQASCRITMAAGGHSSPDAACLQMAVGNPTLFAQVVTRGNLIASCLDSVQKAQKAKDVTQDMVSFCVLYTEPKTVSVPQTPSRGL